MVWADYFLSTYHIKNMLHLQSDEKKGFLLFFEESSHHLQRKKSQYVHIILFSA